MNSLSKLRICDWSLIPLTLTVLASGIQLEILGGDSQAWVWAHIALCLLFTGVCAWHVWLHFKKNNWFSRFNKLKNKVTKILWWVGLLTLVTGVIATVDWINSGAHGHVGAVHGKIGFLMIIFVAIHAVKHIKFYKRR